MSNVQFLRQFFMIAQSPLRYPGGKACLASFLKDLIVRYVPDCTYYELYAGGAGAALSLLSSGIVNKIILNDADAHIYSFWLSILNDTDGLIHKIEETRVDLDSWHKQKYIYDNAGQFSSLEVGFATFFLNRCNRSGILTKAGPIGGFNQAGAYKIDCRFNKKTLINRIEIVRGLSEKIDIYNQDSLQFIKDNQRLLSRPDSFMYLDPPYYKKGKSLYLNAYSHKDHVELRDLLQSLRGYNWMVSYDDVPEIHDLYKDFSHTTHTLKYSLQSKKKTTEFFIFSDTIKEQ